MDADPQLSLELRVCRAYQIPHSTFLAWSKDDRDKAIWEYVRDKQTCRTCGTRRAEWLESEGGHRHAHRPVVDRCPGCEVLQGHEATLDKQKLGHGAYVALVPNVRR